MESFKVGDRYIVYGIGNWIYVPGDVLEITHVNVNACDIRARIVSQGDVNASARMGVARSGDLRRWARYLHEELIGPFYETLVQEEEHHAVASDTRQEGDRLYDFFFGSLRDAP